MTLQIFPKHPDMDAYYVNGSYVPYAVVGRDKRFSDAELAAEYWGCRYTRLPQQTLTIYRFAMHDHHDAQ